MATLDPRRVAALQALLAVTFYDESFEGLDRAESSLLELETTQSREQIDDVFRAIHSIKGTAGGFGLSDVTDLAHVMETLLDQLRHGRLLDHACTVALLHGVDTLRTALHEAKVGNPAPVEALANAVALLRRSLPVAAAPATAPAATIGPAATEGAVWRAILLTSLPGAAIGGTDLLGVLRRLGELGELEVTALFDALPPLDALDPTCGYLQWRLGLTSTSGRGPIDDILAWLDDATTATIEAELEVDRSPTGELPPMRAAPATAAAATTTTTAARGDTHAGSEQASSIRVGIDKIDQLMNMVGELVITQSMLGELSPEHPPSPERLAQLADGLAQLARNTRALQDSVMRLRSMPISAVFGRFPRVVHDLSAKLGKEVDLVVRGQNTELDKTILERLGDPLVHLVRNSLDHGIEGVDARVAAGKPRRGTLTLSAEHRGSDIVIEVRDDGRGLDTARILAVARERGVVSATATPSDAEIQQLIFAPGFSTATEVSEVSGRGVGLDVVRRQIIELGGDIKLESRPGVGTTFALRLPLTLAIIDGQLIKVAGGTYVLPLLSILESVQLEPTRIRDVFGRVPVYRLRDQLIPMLDLGVALGLRARPIALSLMVIVHVDGRPLGLVVDELLAQQQVVIKSLETNYGRIGALAGATILGDGQVAFILDVAGLVASAADQPAPAYLTTPPIPTPPRTDGTPPPPGAP
jgi:two-component system chemotaxis sensor kinase CheA